MDAFHLQLMDNQRAEIKRLRDEQTRLLRALVKGEALICGTPVKLEWPEGMPFGWTEEQLLAAIGQPKD